MVCLDNGMPKNWSIVLYEFGAMGALWIDVTLFSVYLKRSDDSSCHFYAKPTVVTRAPHTLGGLSKSINKC